MLDFLWIFSQLHYADLHFHAFAHNAFAKYFACKLNYFEKMQYNYSAIIAHFSEFDYYLCDFFHSFNILLSRFCHYLNKAKKVYFLTKKEEESSSSLLLILSIFLYCFCHSLWKFSPGISAYICAGPGN